MLLNMHINNKILVAGGAGYIGSHVCKILANSGYIPITLDNLCTGRSDFVKFGPLVKASISDTKIVKNIVKEHNITAIIDLAGSIEVAESMANPLKYYDNNLASKIEFLRILKESGVRAFVFSSSAAVYGEPVNIPISENHQLSPKSPYGWSKMMFEQVLQDFNHTGGINFIALRYFNAAGASFDGDIGEAHEPESHLIPRACLSALGANPPLEIFGNDYPTQDGTAIRDYVHVMDIASAHVMAIELLLKGAESASYNLGSGNGISIREVLAAFDLLGYKVPFVFRPRRSGDPAILVADSTAAYKNLGWKPKYSDISTIISSAFNWHAKNS